MKPFITRQPRPEIGFPIQTLLRNKMTKGEVGIEIEVEGLSLPKSNGELSPYWQYHKDGSLRGKDNAEYVLVKPIAFEHVPEALGGLWNLFSQYSSKIDDSNRTSVHVHLNCQQFHLNRLTAFMALYFTFEEVLTEWCGDHRVGNLFCLRAKDAPSIISQIKKFIKSDGKTALQESLHYAGLNANALHKFGSLEVRTMRGVSDPGTIQSWVGILERMYKMSADFIDPRDICAMFSADGPLSFFENVLGEHRFAVQQAVGWSDDRIRDSMYEGIRLAQDLCYCRDWSVFKSIDLKDDPFGRDPKKVMKQMTAQYGDPAVATISGGWMDVPPPLLHNFVIEVEDDGNDDWPSPEYDEDAESDEEDD